MNKSADILDATLIVLTISRSEWEPHECFPIAFVMEKKYATMNSYVCVKDTQPPRMQIH